MATPDPAPSAFDRNVRVWAGTAVATGLATVVLGFVFWAMGARDAAFWCIWVGVSAASVGWVCVLGARQTGAAGERVVPLRTLAAHFLPLAMLGCSFVAATMGLWFWKLVRLSDPTATVDAAFAAAGALALAGSVGTVAALTLCPWPAPAPAAEEDDDEAAQKWTPLAGGEKEPV